MMSLGGNAQIENEAARPLLQVIVSQEREVEKIPLGRRKIVKSSPGMAGGCRSRTASVSQGFSPEGDERWIEPPAGLRRDADEGLRPGRKWRRTEKTPEGIRSTRGEPRRQF